MSSVEELQERIAWLETTQKIRARYGASLSEGQVKEIYERLLQEERKKAQRIEAEAAQKIKDAQFREEVKKKSRDLVTQGRVLISVEGNRTDTLTEDGYIPCPHCGGRLKDSNESLLHYAEGWLTLKDTIARLGPFSTLTIPGGKFFGVLAWRYSPKCESCGKASDAVTQLVLL